MPASLEKLRANYFNPCQYVRKEKKKHYPFSNFGNASGSLSFLEVGQSELDSTYLHLSMKHFMYSYHFLSLTNFHLTLWHKVLLAYWIVLDIIKNYTPHEGSLM